MSMMQPSATARSGWQERGSTSACFRLRLRLIYLGRIAEKVKYITYLGCAPARREGSRTENWKIYEE